MKTIKSKESISLEMVVAILVAFVLIVFGCSNNDPPESTPSGPGELIGSVTDDEGNPYPSVLVTLDGNEKISRATNEDGNYTIKTKNAGTFDLQVVPPLSSTFVSTPPTTVNLVTDQAKSLDFVVSPQPVEAHVNFGSVQLLEEIVDENGNTPSSPNELLYAKNIFDAPLGQLNPINAPDGHQITLSEFQQAEGELLVHCNGNSSSIEVSLEGMIPNGTYTFWLAYLKKTRKVGEQIDFANDFVNQTNPPIGPSNGSGNIALADANGKIETTLTHSTCILTDEVALVIPVLYHLNGKTFGGGHQPDAEEMVHMLVYFQ